MGVGFSYYTALGRASCYGDSHLMGILYNKGTVAATVPVLVLDK